MNAGRESPSKDKGRFADSMKLTKSYGDMAIGSDGAVFAFSSRYDTGEMIDVE